MRHLYILVLLSFLAACGSDNNDVATSGGTSGSSETPPGNCGSILEANEILQRHMQEKYLWNTRIPSNFDASAHSTMGTAFKSLLWSEDKFSFIREEKLSSDNLLGETFFGYGYSEERRNDTFRVRYVVPGSPAEKGGLQRGVTITEIDGVPIATLFAQVKSGTNTWAKIKNSGKLGLSVKLKWRTPSNETKEATFETATVKDTPVLHHQVIDSTVGDVGYLVFNSFNGLSDASLKPVFQEFADKNIKKMILDLRYNSGGFVDVANKMSASIGGIGLAGNIFYKQQFNDLRANENKEAKFDLGQYATLNIDDLVILSTKSTCSSSELVLNALSAYPGELNTTLIGDSTCGKPVGQQVVQFCGATVFAINFILNNNDDKGEEFLFKGLTPSCKVTDQITSDWGSLNDPLLKEGINYLETNDCSTSPRHFRRFEEAAQDTSIEFYPYGHPMHRITRQLN